VDRKGKEVLMKMASGGLGIDLGIKDFRSVFVFRKKEQLTHFIEKGWDFGAQADAATQSGDEGAAAVGAATVLSGVEVYQITKNGIGLQATLQGTNYWQDADLNNCRRGFSDDRGRNETPDRFLSFARWRSDGGALRDAEFGPRLDFIRAAGRSGFGDFAGRGVALVSPVSPRAC
jgi:hypothetical protein